MLENQKFNWKNEIAKPSVAGARQIPGDWQTEFKDHDIFDLHAILTGGELLLLNLRMDSSEIGEIPDSVLRAFERIRGLEAGSATRDIIRDYVNTEFSSEESIKGFASQLKGHAFEIDYVDFWNSEVLDPGHVAELADSPNQAGFDVLIRDHAGNVEKLIQLKAGDNWDYIREAVERYPDIPIVIPETESEIPEDLIEHVEVASIPALGEDAFVEALTEDAVNGLPAELQIPIISLTLLTICLTKEVIALKQKGARRKETIRKLYVSITKFKWSFAAYGLDLFIPGAGFAIAVFRCFEFAKRIYSKVKNIRNERIRRAESRICVAQSCSKLLQDC